MMTRIIIAFVLLAIASRAMAETKASCPSSITLNGMKIEMALTAPLIIDKKTKELIKSNYNYKGKQLSEPMIAIGFSAIDKDIRWQKNMHETRFTLWYFNKSIDDKIASDIFNDLFPVVNCTEYDFETLKKGTTDFHFMSLSRVFSWPPDSSLWLDGKNNPIGIAVRYNPKRFTCYLGGQIYIPEKNRKNIWKEPFQLCLKVDWYYQ